MKGDDRARPGGEKSLPPMPKKFSQKRKIVSWITPRKVGERPDAASIAEEKARRNLALLKLRGPRKCKQEMCHAKHLARANGKA